MNSTAEHVSTELEPVTHPPDHAPAASMTLFHTDDPVEVVQKASRIADTLKDVLRQRGMIQRISSRDHVKVEGWTTLGAMLGVVPVVAWTRKLENGWEARVEARTLDGRVIGAAEAECLYDEKHWKSRDDYALRSMAQTRAISKALGGPLRFIITLAGYEATPAEEMPADDTGSGYGQQPSIASASDRRLIYDSASGRLKGIELLDCIHAATGQPAHRLDEPDALKALDPAIKALPADKVPVVLQKIRSLTGDAE